MAAEPMDGGVIPTNRVLNQLDPLKDLAEGPTTSAESATVIPMLTQLFVEGGAAWPWESEGVGIGDTKGFIQRKLPDDYKTWIGEKANSMQILRAKHSSGHSQRPEGLYVSQDSGSTDVVKDPKMIVTPGNILDPAGKTKKGVTFLVSNFPTLPYANIQLLGLDTIISDAITMTKEGGNYKVVIPTRTLGTIEGKFDARTFKATDDSLYFAGNPIKNQYIKNFAERKAGHTADECKKYLLCKELGDTLQVEWLNTLFGTAPYTRDNTVIITCDTIVFLRSIINSVGVIFTVKGKTTYYGSRQVDAAQKATIEAAFILSMRNDVINHNQSVLKILQAVIDEARNPETNAWINGNTWTNTQHANCIAFLKKLHASLLNMNKDIDLYFKVITNVEAAKVFAARSHFQNPFVWYPSGGYFKVNKKISYLVGTETYPFPGSEFRPSYFDTSRVDMAGGNRRPTGMTKAEKIANANAIKGDKTKDTWVDVMRLIFAQKDRDKEGYTIDLPEKEIAVKPAVIVGNIDRYDLIIWTINIGGETAADLTRNANFLYVYVRDYHTEIFTYAMNIATAIGNRGLIPFPPDFETLNLTYTINENDVFKIKGGEDIPRSEDLRALVMQAIGLTMKFVDAFPALQTEDLMDFLTLFRTRGHTAYSSVLPDLTAIFSGENTSDELLAAAQSLQQEGGSEIEKSNPLFDAIDLYEIFYAYKIQAVYEDRDLTIEEQKQLEKVAAASSQKNKPMASFKKVAPQLNQNLPIPTVFGGKRFKKTKKRKMSRKKRQTRRSAKRISKK